MKNLKFIFLLLLFSCISLGTSDMSQNTEKAYFAGGCFWCMEPPFEALDGVLEATSGYMGGETENPTYEQVSMGNTGHAEVVEIEYDPNIITYSELLEVFWRNIDPTALNYQFADVGSQYRTEIFTVGPNQMEEALNSKDELEKSNKFDKPIVRQLQRHLCFILQRNIIKTSIRNKVLVIKYMQKQVGEKAS